MSSVSGLRFILTWMVESNGYHEALGLEADVLINNPHVDSLIII